MKIKNLTKNVVLSKDAKYCQDFWDRAFGLLLQSNPKSLLFKTRFGIHTIGMKNPINIIVLDDNFKVNKIKTLLPNRFYFWHPKYQWVLELPVGLTSKISLGDKLDFDPNESN